MQSSISKILTNIRLHTRNTTRKRRRRTDLYYFPTDRSTCSPLKVTCAFIIYMMIAIAAGVTIVCLTSPKPPNQACRLNFRKATKQMNEFDSHPRHLAKGDFNLDGHLDVVVANPDTDNIGIFLNHQNATFALQNAYSTGLGSRPYAVGVADFNNDTHFDIVVALYGINSIGVLFGDGNGHFDPPINTLLGSSRPLSLSVGDMDDDHVMDVVVANYGTSNIAILLGAGNGSFRMSNTYEMGFDSMPYFVTIADLNNDYRLDIIVVNYGTHELAVLLSDKNGNRTLHKYYTGLGSYPCSVTTGHFDDDEALDIAVAYAGIGSVGIFIGHGNETFTNQITHLIDADAHPVFIASGDFNNDTHVDLIVADSKYDRIVVFQGYENGSLAIATRHSTGFNSDPSAMVVGDFDNDYTLDVAIVNSATNNLLLLTSYLRYSYTTYAEYDLSNGDFPYLYHIDIVDFNEDNYLDLLLTHQGGQTISVFINAGNGRFGDRQVYNMGDDSSVVYAIGADINNDHDDDVVIGVDEKQDFSILLGYGNGTLSDPSTTIPDEDYSVSVIAIGDMNKDGNLDIISTDFMKPQLLLYFGLGNGTFNDPITLLKDTGIYPLLVEVSDMNKDSILDIVINDYWNEKGLFILLGHGDGSFQDPLFISTDSDRVKVFTIGDLDNNQQSDIVYASVSPSYVGILLGRGNGTFDSVLKYFTIPGSKPEGVSLGYYNDDAFIDIVVSINNDESINVFLGIGNGSFQTSIRIGIGKGSEPCTVKFADFNNDDQQEIVVASTSVDAFFISTDTLRIVSIHYTSDFTAEISYSTGSNSRPLSVDMGDLNNDGQSDLVLANSGTSRIEVLFHFQNDTFINRTSLSTGLDSYPQSITIADFDQDHCLDIAVVNAWHNNINIFLGSGNGSFASRNVYSTGSDSAPNSIVAGDLNNDGQIDVVVANKGTDNLAVFLAFDYLVFRTHTIAVPGEVPNPFFICTGDFNNDHLVDLAVTNSQGLSLGIYLGYGNGTFSDQITHPTEAYHASHSIGVGDFNNDSNLDLVLTNSYSSTIGVFLGYGNGSFQSVILYSTGDDTHVIGLAVADFNLDERLDFVVSVSGYADQHSIMVFFGTGNGSFQETIVYSMNNQTMPWSLAVDDLNKDRTSDIVVAIRQSKTILILFGHGNGSFGGALMLSAGIESEPLSLTLGDMNQDRNTDIIVFYQYPNYIVLFFGHGNGSFSSPKLYPVDANADPQSVMVTDVNNDTLPDILLCDYNELNSSIAILYGFGDGNFTLPKIYPTGVRSWPSTIAAGDFNRDGRVDLAVTYQNQDQIGVFIQVGKEPFGSASFLFTGNRSQPESVALGDFNNDHRLDIAVTNPANGNIGIFLGHGNGEFADQMTCSLGDNSFPTSIDVAYFNDDEYLDVAIVNTADDKIIILLGNGTGSFEKMITCSTGIRSAPVALVARDLNKDKCSDVVVINRGSNEVLIFVGIGNGSFEEARRYVIGYDTRPRSVTVGHVDNDDMLDIVVGNYGTGQVEVFLQTC